MPKVRISCDVTRLEDRAIDNSHTFPRPKLKLKPLG